MYMYDVSVIFYTHPIIQFLQKQFDFSMARF